MSTVLNKAVKRLDDGLFEERRDSSADEFDMIDYVHVQLPGTSHQSAGAAPASNLAKSSLTANQVCTFPHL